MIIIAETCYTFYLFSVCLNKHFTGFIYSLIYKNISNHIKASERRGEE